MLMRILTLMLAMTLSVALVGCGDVEREDTTPAPTTTDTTPDGSDTEGETDAEATEPAAAEDVGAEAVAVNTHCIVRGEDAEVKSDITKVSYDGQVYGFCCNGCVRRFKEDPASFVSAE